MRAKTVYESIGFVRGVDPKSALDIGMTRERLIDAILASDPQEVYKKNKLAWFNTHEVLEDGKRVKKWKKDALQRMGIDSLRSIYTDIHSTSESLKFQRGIDPKRAMGIGLVRPYPQMTETQFVRWYKEEIDPHMDADMEQAIADNLISNDWESDWEVKSYLEARNIPQDIASELINMREYFNDMDYVTALFK